MFQIRIIDTDPGGQNDADPDPDLDQEPDPYHGSNLFVLKYTRL